MKQKKYTPENITELKNNEIFVFGSNEAGMHIAGAARVAYEKFGAKLGVCEGLEGQSYAIPTLTSKLERISRKDLVVYFDRFLRCVEDLENHIFYLTKVGCGIAGYSEEYVYDILWEVVDKTCEMGKLPKNLIIPKEFEII